MAKKLEFNQKIYDLSITRIDNILWKHYPTYKSHFDDIRQEALLDVFLKLEKYDKSKGEPGAFIYGIVKNKILSEISKIRKHNERTTPLTEVMENYLKSVGIDPALEQDNTRVSEILKGLTPYERKVVKLRVNGYSKTEIWNILHPEKQMKIIGQSLVAVFRTMQRKTSAKLSR